MPTIPMTDESPMPFGKYKGKKMSEVPDYYLLWVWDNIQDLRDPLKSYIANNLEAIRVNIQRSQEKKNINKKTQ
jgi:hypothetical protein